VDDQVKVCPVCGCVVPRLSRNFRVNGHIVWRCLNRRCGVFFEHTEKRDDDLSVAYRDYHSQGGQFQVSLGEAQLVRDLLKRIGGTKTGLKLLDVGCSYGYLLDYARMLGFDTYGVEVAQSPYEFCSLHLKLNVLFGTLEQASLSANTFDAVTMVNVLEHLPKPVETLREVFRVMKPGGRLAVVVPNLLPVLPLLYMHRVVLGTEPLKLPGSVFADPTHLLFWTPKTLALALKNAGFRVGLV